MPETAAIEVRDLVKVFPKGDVRALDGLSFSTPPGTILGVLGPNGAGKTTAVRILSTVLTPDRGSAAILGIDVVKNPAAARRTIGLAGQYAAVDENLSGRQNLYMIGRLSHMSKPAARGRAEELLEQFGLTEAAVRSLKTYSGGMRRRLDLAAALVARPPVLFFDEPTTGLDPQTRQDMWVWTERLVRDGTTVLLTTQYLEEADRLADSVVVVDHGRKIAEGTPETLKADLGATVLHLTVEDPGRASRAAELIAALGSHAPSVEHTRIEMNVENGAKAGSEALRALDGEGIAVVGLVLREPSLDDVFLKLTGHKALDEVGPGPQISVRPVPAGAGR
ncbi:MAG: ATP-binding cassette domain-containing protein [Acidimicrobiales bacterium]